MCSGGRHDGLEEEGDEAADEAVEEAGLSQCETKPLIALDVLAQLRLTGLGLDRGVEHRADPGTRARRATAGARAEADGPTGALDIGSEARRRSDQRVEDGQQV